jgi:cation:H+ antiporter
MVRTMSRLRELLPLGLAALLAAPAVVLRLAPLHLGPPPSALFFGLAILGAAFLLTWAAETAQLDISAGLAIAVLALISVLPEYAVDVVFAWKGGNAYEQFGAACRAPGATTESPCSLALANMTGANRLLIGLGWPLVVFLEWARRRRNGERMREVRLGRGQSIEVCYLGLATLYSLTLPLRSTITVLDAVVLVGIFVAYSVRISSAEAQEPHLAGPAAYLGTLGRGRRWAALGAMFVYATLVILLCAEPFAESLVETGKHLGVSEFLLVQWLAPLASEAPELLVAGLFAWRLNSEASLGTLVSSKVNQWTLLVGSLPVVFAIAAGGLHGLPVEARQREELLLTAAQSVFAVATLLTLSISRLEAAGLFTLFWAQFVIAALVPPWARERERIIVSVVYLVLGVLILYRHRRHVRRVLRDGFLTPQAELRRPVPEG